MSPGRKGPRTLTKLILRQDWQRVLVRAKLFPHELSSPIFIELYDLPLRVLPLHLVCALDPPVSVVSLFLKLNVNAVKEEVAVKKTSMLLSSRQLPRPFKALRKYKRLVSTTSVASERSLVLPRLFRQESAIPEQHPGDLESNTRGDDNTTATLEKSLLNRHTVSRWLPYRHLDSSAGDAGASSSMWGTDDEEEVENSSFMESMSSASMASSSHKGYILQLSPSGGISPFPVGSQETDSTSEFSSGPAPNSRMTAAAPLFGVQWDLTPLWQCLTQKTPDSCLLPVHLAGTISPRYSTLFTY